jgi:hypothetical protein
LPAIPFEPEVVQMLVHLSSLLGLLFGNGSIHCFLDLGSLFVGDGRNAQAAVLAFSRIAP